MPKRILLAEDDSEQLGKWLRELEQVGYRVTACTSGEELLVRLGTSTEDDPYGLMVTDLAMPGMQGTEVVSAVRKNERFKYLPIIVQTTSQQEVVRESVRMCGGIYLSKKASPEFRRAVFERWCDHQWQEHLA